MQQGVHKYIQDIKTQVKQIGEMLNLQTQKLRQQQKSYLLMNLKQTSSKLNKFKKIKCTVNYIKSIISNERLSQSYQQQFMPNALAEYLDCNYIAELTEQTIRDYQFQLEQKDWQIMRLQQKFKQNPNLNDLKVKENIPNSDNQQITDQKLRKCKIYHIFNLFQCLKEPDPKPLYSKRFKSVVKIAIQSLNMFLKILHICPNISNQTVQHLGKQVKYFSNQFNEQYENNKHFYNSQFFKHIRQQLSNIYNKCVIMTDNMLLPCF